jgi:hypothetical protein
MAQPRHAGRLGDAHHVGIARRIVDHDRLGRDRGLIANAR